MNKIHDRTATLTTGALRLHDKEDSHDLDDEIRLLDIDVLERKADEGDAVMGGAVMPTRKPGSSVAVHN